MRKLFLLLGLLAALAIPAFPQTQTVVTGTVTDPNGIPYANGTMKATIQPVPPGSPCVVIGGNCQPIQGTVGPVPLNSSGTFSTNLWANSLIQPSGSQWSIQICISPGVAPPLGTGPQCFSVTTTISGSSQDLSTALDAAAPSLANIPPGPPNPPGSNGALPEFGAYTFYTNSGTIYARNNKTLKIDASGTDLRAVFDTLVGLGLSGGRFFFQQGIYNCNTLDQESTGGFSNYYCLGIPSGGPSQYYQWIFEGESNAPIIDQFGTPVQTSGVVIYVTSAAISSVPANSKIMAVWARPDTVNGVGATVFESNLDFRFPTNQRGCETASDLSQALNSMYSNVIADTAVAQNSLQFPVEASCTSWGGSDRGGLVGLTTTNSSKEENAIRLSYAVGADEGLDIRSEHVYLNHAYAANSNYGIEYGVRGTIVSAPSTFVEAGCATTARCLTLGGDVSPNSVLTLIGYSFEDAASGAFAPVYHAVETNAGDTTGFITFSRSVEGTGNVPLSLFFDGGGGSAFTQVGPLNANYIMNSNGAQQEGWIVKTIDTVGTNDASIINTSGSRSATTYLSLSQNNDETSGGVGNLAEGFTAPFRGVILLGVGSAGTNDNTNVSLICRVAGCLDQFYTGATPSLAMTLDSSQNANLYAHLNQASASTFATALTISSSTTGTFTFADAYNSAPVCTVTPRTALGTTTYSYAVSASAVTVTLSVSGSDTFDIICVGNPN